MGDECEAVWLEPPNSSSQYISGTFKGGFDSKIWFGTGTPEFLELVIPAHKITFRPLNTEREKVIEYAMAGISGAFTGEADNIIGQLYDAGMLTMPKE